MIAVEEIVKSKMRLVKIGHPSPQPVECVIRGSPSSSSAEERAIFKSKILVSTRTVMPCSSHKAAIRDPWSCIERNGKAIATSSTTLLPQELRKTAEIRRQSVATPPKCLHTVPVLIHKPSDSVPEFGARNKPVGKLQRSTVGPHNDHIPQVTPALSHDASMTRSISRLETVVHVLTSQNTTGTMVSTM